MQHECAALAGLCMIGMRAFLLCLDDVTEVAQLPLDGGPVYCVNGCTWLPMPHASSPPLSTDGEQEAVNTLGDFPLPGTHFFAPNSDLTAPFPHALGRRPCPPFAPWLDWTAALRKPFANAGLAGMCVVLLRGAACSAQLLSSRQGRYECLEMLMLSRKCNSNASPRFSGRGLNAGDSPGNEYDCELFLWWVMDVHSAEPLQWARYGWRRGVPEWVVSRDWGRDAGLMSRSWRVQGGRHPEACVPGQGTAIPTAGPPPNVRRT